MKESLLRYEECVNNMPSDNLLYIDADENRLVRYLREDRQFATCSKEDKDKVEGEIQTNYLRAQNEILF